MRHIARYFVIFSAVIVMAVYIPLLYDLAFGERISKTHMFYSPVIDSFVWREKLVGDHPEKVEDTHHAQFIHTDEKGSRYTREEFEKLLPFIYCKNMELWGKLPLHLHGETFDKATIKANRQVLELNPTQVAGNAPHDEIYPLLESRPKPCVWSFRWNAYA